MDAKVENKSSDETIEGNQKDAPKEEKVKKGEDKTIKEIKTKLTLSTSPDHPLSHFQNETKKRNIKDVNLNNIILEAIGQIPASWWEEKIESLTPLEYKVQEALKSPGMREKLASLLVDDKKEGDTQEESSL